eukprot:5659402-Alexandrium_andersonii.AAC.1
MCIRDRAGHRPEEGAPPSGGDRTPHHDVQATAGYDDRSPQRLQSPREDEGNPPLGTTRRPGTP